MSIVKQFPPEWLIDVVVHRGGGRNTDGTLNSAVQLPLSGVLFAPNSDGEPSEHSEQTAASPALYFDTDSFVFVSTDRVELPDGRVYAVDGDPEVWPLDGVVNLRKE